MPAWARISDAAAIKSSWRVLIATAYRLPRSPEMFPRFSLFALISLRIADYWIHIELADGHFGEPESKVTRVGVKVHWLGE